MLSLKPEPIGPGFARPKLRREPVLVFETMCRIGRRIHRQCGKYNRHSHQGAIGGVGLFSGTSREHFRFCDDLPLGAARAGALTKRRVSAVSRSFPAIWETGKDRQSGFRCPAAEIVGQSIHSLGGFSYSSEGAERSRPCGFARRVLISLAVASALNLQIVPSSNLMALT
jgi:hypothetical protein